MCRNIPIFPGATASPFHDFLDEIASLPEPERKRVVGVGNYRLIGAGLATWQDVVTAARVRTLSEVLARVRPTDRQLQALGVRRPPAVPRPPSVTPPARAADALSRLRAAGLSDEEIRRRLAERVARRFGISRTAPAPSVGTRLGLRASP